MEQELIGRLEKVAKQEYWADWQDVVQQAWLDLAEAGKLEETHTNSYLRMICRDAWAKAVGNGRTSEGLRTVPQSVEALEELGEQFSTDGGRTNPLAEAEAADAKAALQAAIGALRAEMRALVVAKMDASEPTLAELAERFEVEDSTILRRLDEAYRVLRTILADYAPEKTLAEQVELAETIAELPLFAAAQCQLGGTCKN